MAKTIELRPDVKRGKIVAGVAGEVETLWRETQDLATKYGYSTAVNRALSEKVAEAVAEIHATLTQTAHTNGRMTHEEDR